MQNTPIRKVSKSQQGKNAELAKIKKQMSGSGCILCGLEANDLAHLLPKSIYPEYYTLKDNLVLMCRRCHDLYDNNRQFRSRQLKLKLMVEKYDPRAAEKYFSI